MMNKVRTNRTFKTNDYSIVSKASSINAGYFPHDRELLLKFKPLYSNSGHIPKRADVVNRGYAARMYAVQSRLSYLLQNYPIDAVIIFGAGYDTLSLRNILYHQDTCCSKSKGRDPNVVWFNIDLPQVIETLVGFLNENSSLPNVTKINDKVYFWENYYLVACDLCNVDNYIKLMSPLIRNFKHLLLVNEVCFCYIEDSKVSKILQATITCSCYDASITYLGFEQYKPCGDDGFSNLMTNHFASYGYSLKYFPTEQKLRNVLNRERSKFDLLSMFRFCSVNEFINTIFEAHVDKFDDYEGLDLYLGHYALVTAVIKSPIDQKVEDIKCDTETMNELEQEFKTQNLTSRQIKISSNPHKRYSHASCCIKDIREDDKYLILGGVGIDSKTNQHGRREELVILNLNNNFTKTVASSPVFRKQYSQMCFIENHNLVYISGGRESFNNEQYTCSLNSWNSNDNTLSLKHSITDLTSIYRHKSLPLKSASKVVDIGGIHYPNSLQQDNYIQIKDLETIKTIKQNDEDSLPILHKESLARHSFASDIMSNDCILLYGGLSSKYKQLHKPIDKQFLSTMIDLRCQNTLIKLDCIQTDASDNGSIESYARYGCTGHFVTDNIFLIVGGISTLNGLCDNSLLLYDIRNKSISKILPKFGLNEDPQMILVNHTSHFNSITNRLTIIGGGGNYFTFGTHFNKYIFEVDIQTNEAANY